MSLIKCPECQHDISNTAINCPNCGCNIKKAQKAQAEILAKEQWDKMPKKEKTIATIITLVIIAVVAIFLFKEIAMSNHSAIDIFFLTVLYCPTKRITVFGAG